MPVRSPRVGEVSFLRVVAVLAAIFGASGTARSQVAIRSVVNAASFQSVFDQSVLSIGGVVFPSGGALATVFCSGITTNPGLYATASSMPLPSVLGGVSVQVNGSFAPLLAVIISPQSQTSAYAQINFQVPLERNSSTNGSPQNVVITVNSKDGFASLTIDTPANGVGGFFSDGNGYVIAQHTSDYSPVTVQNPAHAGETIIVYADDFFEVWPPPPVGFPVPQQPLFAFDTNPIADADPFYTGQKLYLQTYPQSTLYGGTFSPSSPPLQILFEGLAPGMIGVEQINFVVPANQQPGDWPLFFNVYVGHMVISTSSPYVKLPVR